jgi:hypothetical protein
MAETATVHVDGKGTPHPVEHEETELHRGEGDQGEGDEESEGDGWQRGLSEIRDQVSELTTATEKKFSEFQQAISDRMTAAQTELRELLETRPSTSPSSPSEETPPNPESEPKPENNESQTPENNESNDSESESAKPAAAKFRTVLRRRRSI